MPAMQTGFIDQNCSTNERYLCFLEARAQGGVGLIIAEALSDNLIDTWENRRELLHQKTVLWMQELSKKVHTGGARVALQLKHRPNPGGDAHALENYQERLLEAFLCVADLAASSGFDALEIKGDFYSKSNDATSAQDLIYNIIKAFREKIKLPLIYRLGEAESLKLEDALHLCKIVEMAGVSAIHISVDLFQTLEPPGFTTALCAAVKKAVRIPVIAAGRINRPEMGAELLQHGTADFVSMGRALLADPKLPRKAQQGVQEQIRPCIGCNEGCVNRYMAGEPVTCVQNLAVGREKELAGLPQSEQRQNVLVVGGGPAGMTAAKYLAVRGHGVRLVEKLPRLGGQVNVAALVPGKQDYRFISTCLEEDLAAAGVEVLLNTQMTDLPATEKPAAVIVASGSEAKTLPTLPGLTVPVITARDIIASNDILPEGQVVIIGGGLLGLEAAYTLATRGKEVIVVEQEKEIARDGAPVYNNHLLTKLEDSKVEILTGTAVFGGEGAIIQLQDLLSGKTRNIHAGGGVILAVGSDPVYPQNLPFEGDNLHIIGDARMPGKILAAMEEALSLALNI